MIETKFHPMSYWWDVHVLGVKEFEWFWKG